MADVILVVCAFFAFWKLEITVEKGKNQSMWKNLKGIAICTFNTKKKYLQIHTKFQSQFDLGFITGMVNPAVVIFFTMIFVCGVTFGVTQSLVNLRLQDLNAPSSMIGTMNLKLHFKLFQNYVIPNLTTFFRPVAKGQ